MIVVPRNRIDMAFPMRLMFVLPAICPREVETRLFYKDKLEFTGLSHPSFYTIDFFHELAFFISLGTFKPYFYTGCIIIIPITFIDSK